MYFWGSENTRLFMGSVWGMTSVLASKFWARAVVTPDGEWHEQGEMSWWGLSSETDEEALGQLRGFRGRFLDTADSDWAVTVVDCHI